MMSNETRMLVWKELRRQRTTLISSVIFTAFPYILWLCMGLAGERPGGPSDFLLAELILAGSTMAILLSCMMAAFFAGNALAGERPARSIEFLSYLPVSRIGDLRSRVITAAGLSVGLLLVHVTIFSFFFVACGPSTFWGQDAFLALVRGFTTMLAFFGVSWLASMILKSPVIATVCGIVAVALIALLGIRIGLVVPRESVNQHFWNVVYPLTTFFMGVIGLTLGSFYHLKRRMME